MPVATGGDVFGFPHDAVGSPSDGVRDSGGDGEAAPRAQIAFDRGGRRNGLHVPEPVPTLFGSQSPVQRPRQVNFVVCGVCARSVAGSTGSRAFATRSIGSRHESTLICVEHAPAALVPAALAPAALVPAALL